MSNIYDTLLGVTTGNYNSAADSTAQNPINDTKIYDADTVYQNGEGYRIEGIDAPEMPTKDLKLNRLQKAKESKLGQHISKATAGEAAALEAQFTELDYNGIDNLDNVSGKDYYNRNLVDNPQYQNDIVARGYAVPAFDNKTPESIDLMKTAMESKKGLWADPEYSKEMMDKFTKRNDQSTIDYATSGTKLNQEDWIEGQGSRGWGNAIADTGLQLVAGSTQFAKNAGDIYGLATGNMENPVSEVMGKATDFYREKYSPELKVAQENKQKAVSQVDGEWDKFLVNTVENLSDPKMIMSTVVESLPSMIAAAGVGGVTSKLLQLPTMMGVNVALGVGAVQQGADMGAEAYERINNLDKKLIQEMPEYKEAIESGKTPEEAQKSIALNISRVVAGVSGGLSLALNKGLPGGAAIESALLGKNIGSGIKGYTRGVVGESATEVGEEVGGLVAQNVGVAEVNPEQKLMENTGVAASEAMLAGGTTAGIIQAPVATLKTLDETVTYTADKLKREPKETAEVVKDIKTRADEVFADEPVIDTTEVEQRIATANDVINNPEATAEDVELAKQSLAADQDVLSKSADRLKVDKLADVLEIEADVLELDEKDPTKAEYLEKIKNVKREVAKEIEELDDPVEYGKRLGSKARFLDVLDDVVEVSDETELSGKLADNLRQIAATFGVTDETFNQKIKKDFATVELEATKSSKGYMTQGKALRAILSATTPDAKKVNKLVTKMQNYQATQEKWLDRFDKAVSEVNSELKAYNDAPNKDIVPKPSEKPRKFDVSKNSKFDLKVKELDDGTFAISTMDQMNAIADAKRQNIAGIQNELGKSKELLEKAGIGQDTTGIQTDIIIDSETIPQKMKVSVDNAIKHFTRNKVNAFIGEEGAKGSRNSWILKDNKQLTNKNTYTKDDVVGILAPNIANDVELKAFKKSLVDPKSVIRKQLDAAAKAGATIVIENDTRVKGKTDKSTNLRNKAKGLLVSQVVTYKGYQSIGDAEGKGLSRVLKPKEVASKERLDKIVQEKAKREVAKVKADALAKKLDEYVGGKEVTLDGVEQYFTEVDKLKSYLENTEQKKIAEYIKLTKEKSKLEKLLDNMATVAEGKDNEKRLAEVNKELAGSEKFADKAKDKIIDTAQKKVAGKNLLKEYKEAKLVDELDPEGTAVEEFMVTLDNDYVQESLSNSSSKGADNMYITYAEGKTPKVGSKETADAIEHILDINKLVKQTNQPLLGAIEIEDMFDNILIDGVEVELSATEYMKDAKNLLNDTITQSYIKPEVTGKRTVLDWTLKDSPAYGLLFNKDGEINDTTVLAIKLAIDEYIAYNAKMLSATYKSREDVAQMVGIIEPALGDNQYELLKDVGVFKKTMSNEIGRGILTKLGLGKIKEVETESYNKLLAELGHMGVMVGINTGLLEETTLTVEEYSKAIDADTGTKTKFDPDKYAVETDAKGMITFVREVLDKEGKKQIDEMAANTAIYEAVHELLDDTSAFRKEPSKTPIKNRRHEKEQVAKDITGNKIPTGGKDKGFTSSKEAINNLIDTKWKVNTKLIQKIKDMSKEQQDVLKDWMGFKTVAQMDLMAYDARLAQESVNRDIEKSITELTKLVDENASDKLYFDWFYSSNGRYMLDSNTVNPQTDKQLHRWLITPAKQSLNYARKGDKFTVDGEDMTDMVKYAVAQAFGYDVDKQKTTDIMEFADKLLGLDEQQITELETAVFTNGEEYKIGDTKIEPEHIGHMMQGIDFLREAKKDKFTSNLSAEFDAVTSGFGLKLLQIPILGSGLETMWKWLNKVGVFKSNQLNGFNSMNDILKSDNFYGDGKKFFDSYQTLASEADVTSAIFGDKHSVSKGIFKSVASVLPKLDANGEVSKALRTLFKDPFMTFNYSAGIASIKRSLSNNMLANMINEIVAEEPKEEYVKVTQDLAKQFGTTPAKLIEELRNTALNRIRFDSVGFEKTMFDMFYNSYGTKVEQIMTDNFGEFMAAHKDINAAFRAMFEVFNVMYKAEVAKVKKGQLTDEKKLEIIDELRKYFPVIKGPLSEGIEDGISIYKTGSVTPSVEDQRQTPAQTYIKDKDGKVKSSMIRYRIKEFEAAISAGSVVPIHYIDGSLMAQLLGKDAGITAIHDAIIPPLNMAKELIQKYNENMIKIAKTYSVVGAINDMLNRVDTADIANMDKKINVEDLVKSAETGKRVYKDVSIKSYFNEMKTRIAELNTKVEAGREALFDDMEENGVAVGHMAAVPGSMYNSKGEVEAKQEDVKIDKKQIAAELRNRLTELASKEKPVVAEEINKIIDSIKDC